MQRRPSSWASLLPSLSMVIASAMAPVPCAVGASRPDPAALEARIRALLDEHGGGVVASVWVGGKGGDPWFAREAEVPRPAASAIKTAYLVALFARFADDLDASPPGLDDALADDHPAMAPYSPGQRDEIRAALRGASARTLGGVMMGSIPAPNHVYNAAASCVTALFGGPEGLTAAIRALDPGFAPISARRYMLAPRGVTGDNEASAAALAMVMRRVVAGDLPGVEAGTLEAIRGAIIARDGHLGLDGRHQFKGGSLDTDPMARIHSGWWEVPDDDGGPIVYAVMLSRPVPGDRPRSEAGDRLEALAGRITAVVLESARDARVED